MASASATLHELPMQMVRLPKVECRPRKCTLILGCCDAVSIISALCIGYAIKLYAGGHVCLATYVQLWPSLFVFFAVFASLRLYPGIICNSVTELERLTAGISLSFAVLAASTFINHKSSDYSRAVFFLAWASAIVLVPLLRSLARAMFSAKPWWGVPAVMFYTGEESSRVLQMLSANHGIGIKVVAVLASPNIPVGKHSLSVFDYRHASVLRSAGVSRALIALPENSPALLLKKLEAFESMFPKLMLLNDAFSHYSLSAAAQDLGGALSMEVRRNLLDPVPRMIKRSIDLILLAIIAPIVVPLTFFLAGIACIGSKGTMFYRHRRIGRGNSTIHVWKIRTMHQDSDAVLQKALARDPMLHAEWLSSRKLLRDPRITPVGRILRRTSLDELPQMWNVLRGEMSLVGPRPIVDEEVDLYGDRFDLYCRVTPGLTGLWQVSGRSRMSVDERVRLDSYYVKNWSPWLDLHILARTTKVVITGDGAY